MGVSFVTKWEVASEFDRLAGEININARGLSKVMVVMWQETLKLSGVYPGLVVPSSHATVRGPHPVQAMCKLLSEKARALYCICSWQSSDQLIVELNRQAVPLFRLICGGISFWSISLRKKGV
jgi:hypothetical protein